MLQSSIFFVVLVLSLHLCVGNIQNIPVNSERFFLSRETSTLFPTSSFHALRIDNNGEIRVFSETKQQLASELELPLRDLRMIDPSFPGQIQATFAARPHAILLTLEDIKIIIKSNEVIVFSPSISDDSGLISTVQQQLQALYKGEISMCFEHVVIETALNVACNNLLQKVRTLAPAVSASLNELQAESLGLDIIQTQVDGLLPVKNQLDGLQKRVREIDRAIKEVLDSDVDMTRMHLTGNMQTSQHLTRSIRASQHVTGNALPSIDTRSDVSRMTALHSPPSVLSSHHKHSKVLRSPSTHRRFHPTLHSHTPDSPDSTNSIQQQQEQQQEEEEDGDKQHVLSAALSEQPPVPAPLHSTSTDSNKMNLEMLLETYLHQINWIGSEIDSHLDQIRNTEQNVALQMDLLRNRILRFELTLSLSSFIVSCAALVTGMFGMNLLSHLELHRDMFWLVSIVLVVGMVTSYGQFKQYVKKEGLF